jgi:hypothetical protein
MIRLLFVFSLLICCIANAQEGTVLLSKKQVKIGEPFTLAYKVKLKTSQKPKFYPASSILPCFISNSKDFTSKKAGKDALEIQKAFRDTVIKTASGLEWIGVYDLIAWDSGFYQLPVQQVELGKQVIHFPVTMFEVKLAAQIPGKALFDIEEVALEEPSFGETFSTILRQYGWIIALICLTVLIVFVWKKRKRKKRSQVKTPTPESQAIDAIDRLNQKRLWESGQLKLHYVELSMILRQFISSIYTINFLERTTTETELLLREKQVDKALIRTLTHLLEEADLVKFAKSKPESTEILARSNQAKALIKELYAQPNKENVN